LAPMPSANVSTTVNASPLVRSSERSATLRSLTNDIILLFLPGGPSQAIEADYNLRTRFASFELRNDVEERKQIAIHRVDQSKLFPMIVLRQNASLPYVSHCAIVGRFVQIRTASVVQAAGHVLHP
jgi:hypothetical protein